MEFKLNRLVPCSMVRSHRHSARAEQNSAKTDVSRTITISVYNQLTIYPVTHTDHVFFYIAGRSTKQTLGR